MCGIFYFSGEFGVLFWSGAFTYRFYYSIGKGVCQGREIGVRGFLWLLQFLFQITFNPEAILLNMLLIFPFEFRPNV